MHIKPIEYPMPLSPAEILSRQVWKLVKAQLAQTIGRRPALYDLIMGQAEKPLLLAVLSHCRWNQSHAALALGINRNTLSKKLRAHRIGA